MTNNSFLLEGIGEAILMLDHGGYIKYANPATATLTGYSCAELINQPITILYQYDNDDVKTEFELGLVRKKGKFISEGWKRRKDKTRFWAEMSLFSLHEKNILTGYACILRDISDRKQNELLLRENEERFRLMVDGVRDYAIFMLDTTGHILTWNEGAKRTKGYTA